MVLSIISFRFFIRTSGLIFDERERLKRVLVYPDNWYEPGIVLFIRDSESHFSVNHHRKV